MADPELLERFNLCLRYKRARPWQKPLLNPLRFVRNQLRVRGLPGIKAGELGEVAAFHLPRFTVVNGESVSECIAAYGIYEETLTEAFLRVIQPAQLVVDVGMHLGYYATLFARLVGPRGAVHAFEPTPSTREIAANNLRPFYKVTVHPLAVWSSAQKLTFHDYGPQWMAFNSFTAARVKSGPLRSKEFVAETISLDSFRSQLNREIALVKIDAESAEEEILKGAQGLLRSDQPLVSLEVGDEVSEGASCRLIEFMREAHYTVWEFSDGKFERHQAKKHYEYDNLIFAPDTRNLGDM